MDDKTYKDLTEIKNRYANHLLLTVVIIGFIALLVSLKETINRGWSADSFTDSIGYSAILILYIFRKKIPVEIKIGALIISATATGMAGLITNSVIGMFAPYFVFAAVFSVIFFEFKVTLFIVIFQILFLITIFILKVKGLITFGKLDPYYRAFHNDNWLNYIATFILFVTIIVILSHSFYERLKHNNRSLSQLNIKLKEEISEKEKAFLELRESNELVAAAEDELRASNDELVYVNEELSKKNDELAKYHNYLEDIVKERTQQIYELNDKLSKTNDDLINSNEELKFQKEELAFILEELKKTQAGLVQSEKMASLGILTAGIAHEINNPINFISGGVYGLQILLGSIMEYLKDCKIYKKESNEEINLDNDNEIVELISGINKLIQNILIGVDRSSSIIKSLKVFSYTGTGSKEIVNIHEGINATLIMLQHIYKNRITVHKLYGNVPDVSCNSSQLNQVFMNILTNAIDSINDKGEITIKTSYNTEHNKIIISISDTGEGIPPSIQQHIFEPFYTTKEAGKGTGLGLSISYNIIKEHRGEIYFESSPDAGTTFFIELPVDEITIKNTIG